ncbi:hypothetical protein QQ020_23880 [Fulvivirgaceae bacterium BMA12]|uniref:DUF2147 domain-containing protein n=1 Tax=Agaribacillus aureus TaxID=3051825 RepID=A0ABT8LDJ7_9BACT|nr:hypothetical protein [Fulvivirgaceae bacterium BMA12]
MALVIVAFACAHGQSNSLLIGKWKTSYNDDGEKGFITYEIKTVDGKLKGHTQYIEDDKGNGEDYSSLVLKNIRFSDGKGKATYVIEYEGETYEAEASLTLVDVNTLKIHYSYMGYSDTETWKRVK